VMETQGERRKVPSLQGKLGKSQRLEAEVTQGTGFEKQVCILGRSQIFSKLQDSGFSLTFELSQTELKII